MPPTMLSRVDNERKRAVNATGLQPAFRRYR
jgi:hypothetical protein